MHHFLFHGLELIVVGIVTLSSFGFTNITGLNQELYTNSATETAEHLLTAMQNPGASLKQGNIISIRSMDMDIENTFAKGYCTYGAARISPEFFPYIDTKTQQRTRGGNAVDRCKNAADTGYKIGTTPTQGAFIIYNAGGRFGNYGHVGKVMHYDKSLKKLIVRDMARVGRGQMSDRREDLTTANVECYIYNSKTTIPTDSIIIPTVNTGIIVNTTGIVPTLPTTVPTPPTTPTTPIIPVVITPTVPTPPTTPVVIPTTPTVPQIIVPTIPTVVSQDSIYKNLSLEFNNLSDIAKHFMTQNDLVITLVSKTPIKLGEVATATLKIKDKKTGEKYSGLLPFSFSILSTNNILEPNISNIKLVNDGSVDIAILGQKVGTATIVITMDGTKIGEFSLEVK